MGLGESVLVLVLNAVVEVLGVDVVVEDGVLVILK